MRCRDLEAELSLWLRKPDAPYELIVDDGAVRVCAYAQGTRLEIALDLPSHDDALLDAALQLAHTSLQRFPAALARAPKDGRLWLVSEHRGTALPGDLLDLLEVILNQRDAWQLSLAQHIRRIPGTGLRPTILAEDSRYA
ncbi:MULTISPECIES: hypothetical protein [Pseudomonas]|uniref:hypothetical protein n=1 Tax=Pseudomonas TaxID=286 RepID=UPI0023621B51|nr:MULTISPECIES: hypothetical protein [unclassified Pseudomonas]